jgi:uncharacterized Zn-finger protein
MADRYSTCPQCGLQFSYPVSRGSDRIFCSSDCVKIATAERLRIESQSWQKCLVDGCDDTVRSAKATLCERHYYRIRRNGSNVLLREKSPPPDTKLHTHGYIVEYMPDHPLWSETKGRIYQHRRVFFDHHGKGPHPCNWCGKVLEWSDIDVDHLNAVRHDNRQENLVASCHRCNISRGRDAMTTTKRQKSNSKITWNGETLTQGEWADRIGITRQSLRFRISSGWPIARALTEGRGASGPLKKSKPSV